ncbi:MAG: hypothetical protein ACLQVJ_10015 [Syntrophobacteraceae bacterium]
MNPTLVALVVFVFVFGGTLLGMYLRIVIPEHHLSEDSKDVIKLGMGLIATIAALVLGLVIASARTSHDEQDAAIKHIAAKIMLLDRQLALYGPETKESRDLLRHIIAKKIDELWPKERSQPSRSDTSEALREAGNESLEYRIRQLAPQNVIQQGLQSRALEIGNDISETRWIVSGATGGSVPLPFLVVVVLWLTFIFGCFGIFAPRNSTVIAVLFVCALSVACAIFLILELDQPFRGVMKISSTPLRETLSHLCQ